MLDTNFEDLLSLTFVTKGSFVFNLTSFNNISNMHVITVSSISKTFYKRCLRRFI